MITTKTTYAGEMSDDFYQFVADDMGGNWGMMRRIKKIRTVTRFWDSVISRGRAAGMIAPSLTDKALIMYLDMYVQYFGAPTSHPLVGSATVQSMRINSCTCSSMVYWRSPANDDDLQRSRLTDDRSRNFKCR